MWDDSASAGLESVSEPDFSSEDEDEDDGAVDIHSPLHGSLTLPARRQPPGSPGLWRQTSQDQATKAGRSDGEIEDLSATIRSLGMERDETVRGGLSGVVDSKPTASSADQKRQDAGSQDDPYESMPPTPRLSAPGGASGYLSRPSVMLVQPREQPLDADELPNPVKAETVRR
jgi:hypothetical protein